MCDICDGKTHDQVEAETRGHIRRLGWALRGVEPSPESHGWVYTIGLLDSYDHPELVLVDDDWARGGALLNVLGRAVRDGDILQPGDTIDLGERWAEVIDVHPEHLFSDVLALWYNVRGPGSGLLPLDPEAYQVVVHGTLPDGDVLPDVRLDRPGPVLGRHRPAGAEERAAARWHGPR